MRAAAADAGGDLRARALAEARRWLGTPYRHQASVQDVGADCLGLVRGVRRALGGPDETPPPYRPDWAEISPGEPLLEALRTRLVEIAPEAARPGDVLVFRMAEGAAAKHCAILSGAAEGDGEAKIIHAYWGRAVVESWLGPWWRRRLAAAFTWAEGCEWRR